MEYNVHDIRILTILLQISLIIYPNVIMKVVIDNKKKCNRITGRGIPRKERKVLPFLIPIQMTDAIYFILLLVRMCLESLTNHKLDALEDLKCLP